MPVPFADTFMVTAVLLVLKLAIGWSMLIVGVTLSLIL